MNVRDLESRLEGDVVEAPRRTLSEREMPAGATSPRTLGEKDLASVRGGGPPVIDPDDDCARTPSICVVNGAFVADDCAD